MLNKIIGVFIIVMLSSIIINSQTLTEQEKQEIIYNLRNANTIGEDRSNDAIRKVIKYKINEAVPEIETYFNIQDNFGKTKFLEALDMFNSPNVVHYAKEFLDSLDLDKRSDRDYLFDILSIMFENGDISKYQLALDELERSDPILESPLLYALSYIAKNIPEAREKAINGIKRIAVESDDQYFRFFAFHELDLILGKESIPFLLERLPYENVNSTSTALYRLLAKHKSPLIDSFIREQVNLDYNKQVREALLFVMVENYNTPRNYKFMQDLYKNNPTKFSGYIFKSNLYFSDYIREPDSNITNIDLLDTLFSFTKQCYNVMWLKDEAYKTELLNKLTNAKTKLTSGDSLGCRTEVVAFQNSVAQVYADSAGSYPKYVSEEGYKFLYYYSGYILDRLPEPADGLPVKLEDSQGNLLQGGSLQYYDGGWKDAIDNGDGTFTVQTERTTVSLKMHYAGGSQQKDNVTVGADTVVFQTTNVTVKLLSSQNTLLDSGFVQYYASGWQDFGTLVNGTAHKELLSKNYTFKVKYAGSDKNKVQNLDTNTTVTFHTVNTEVQLQDSQGNLLPVPSGDGGEAEYYASGWKTFGELTNGKANKELLSRKYTFKVKYAGAENNLVQDLDSSTTVIFHTVNTTVQLKDSQGNLLDGGFAQYYAGGWQDFGAATNGVATKELLPKSYNFKMKYGGTDKDIVQDITNNSTVTFQTVNAEIQLRDSQGNLLDGGFAKYYASGWKDFGAAANGIAHKELLSRAYTFKIQYGGADINHVQNLDTNTTVVFNTINVTVQLKDSQGNLLDSGEVEYYASGWKTFGSVVNGTVTKELLPRNYTFKMIHGGLNTTKDQDVSVNSMVNFATTLTTVRVKDNQGQVVENAEALYYGGGWKQIGFTNATGEVSKELLGRTITFKAKKDSKEKNKQQDTSTNSVVEIILE